MFLSGMLTRGRIRLKMRPLPRAGPFVRWLLVAGWMGGVFYLSQQSSPLGASPGRIKAFAAHLVLYGALAVLLYWALLASARGEQAEKRPFVAVLSLALTVLYGVSDELHQAFVPGRTASEADLLVDAIGGLLGLAVALAWQRAFLALRARLEDISAHP